MSRVWNVEFALSLVFILVYLRFLVAVAREQKPAPGPALRHVHVKAQVLAGHSEQKSTRTSCAL